MTEPSVSSVTVRAGAQPPSDLTAAQAERWGVERELWAPRTITTASGGHALTAGRPHTAARKIIDVHAPTLAAFREVVAAALTDEAAEHPTHRTPLVVRFEEHPASRPLTDEQREVLRDLGFTAEPDPVPSVPSTRPNDATWVRGWSHWVGAAPSRTVPYYGQTTDVTCGAVAALMHFEAGAAPRFGADELLNQGAEISFWRAATNLPACEPVGLAVATAREAAAHGASEPPRIILSTPELVLLEWYAEQPDELRLRTQLQEESRREALALGIAREERWIEVTEIRDLVATRHRVFLLIALAPLIGDPAPHWVLAHDVVDDTVIISDPWVEAEHGESWVDSTSLPVPLADLDLITRWGDPAYRGVVVLPPETLT